MDLKELDDPEKFIAEDEVELFPAHKRYGMGPTGRVLIRDYSKDVLERYVKNIQEREKSGCPPAMTIGHTVDDQKDAKGVVVRYAREEDQPRVVGYWRKWSLKWSAQKQKYCLCATPYYDRRYYEEAKTYPRASVETIPSKEIIDPVAILRRAPDQPVQVSFAAKGERYRPAASEQRYRYSMETGDMEPEEKTGNPGTDPAGPPSATAPSAEEMDKFSACCQAKYPNMDAMHQKFSADMAAATVAPPAVPAVAPPAPTAKPAMPPEAKDKMSAMEADLAEERRKNAATRHTLDILTKNTRQAERRSELEKLRDVEKFAVDVDKELKDTESDSPERFAAHVANVRKFYRQDPTAERPWLEAQTPGADKFGAEEQEKVNLYLQQHHDELQKLPWEQRWNKARKFATTGKAD